MNFQGPHQPSGKVSQLIYCSGQRVESSFDIELAFLDEFSDKHAQLIRDAVTKWRSVIIEGHPFDGVPRAPFFNYHETTMYSYKGEEFVVPYGDRIKDLRIYFLTHSASFHAA